MGQTRAAAFGVVAGAMLCVGPTAFAADDPLTAIIKAARSHDCATILSLYPPYWEANNGMPAARRRNLDSAYNICIATKQYWTMLDQLGPGFPDKP